MKKQNRIKFSIIFIITIILAMSTFDICFSKNRMNLFEEILNKTTGEVVQCGIYTSFNTKIYEMHEYKDMLNKIVPKAKVNKVEGKDYYCLKFKKEDTKGDIEVRKNNNEYKIIISISCKSKLELYNLKEKMERQISLMKTGEDNKIFYYVKAKIENNDLALLNEEIMKYLKQNDAKNIQTIKLDNGYSTVCYTGMFDCIYANGNLIDLNYSICRYDSGNYLVIGTPQIVLDY